MEPRGVSARALSPGRLPREAGPPADRPVRPATVRLDWDEFPIEQEYEALDQATPAPATPARDRADPAGDAGATRAASHAVATPPRQRAPPQADGGGGGKPRRRGRKAAAQPAATERRPPAGPTSGGEEAACWEQAGLAGLPEAAQADALRARAAACRAFPEARDAATLLEAAAGDPAALGPAALLALAAAFRGF